jgi:hypothetical protein
MGTAAWSPERTLSHQEVLDLPASVDLVTAGLAFGIGRTMAHQLARNGEFPCRVLRLGNAYRVPRAEILRALGITEPDSAMDSPLENTA